MDREEMGDQRPADESAERAILASIFEQNDLINLTEQSLKLEDFYFPKHRLIYAAMAHLSSQQEPIDSYTLTDCLKHEGAAEEFKDVGFYLSFSYEPFYSSNLDAYIRIVKEYSTIRSLIDFGDQIKQLSLDGTNSTSSILAEAEQRLVEMTKDQLSSGMVPIEASLAKTLKRTHDLSLTNNDITGISTGFRALDRQLQGLQKSDLILLAGRPSMGKTALGLNIAYNAARYQDKDNNHPYRVAIFSLEMSNIQVTQRLWSMASGVNLQKIISGQTIDDDEWGKLGNAYNAIKDLKISIDDTSSLSIEELRSKCRRMKIEKGLDLVVVDYLQLMTVDNARSSENRQQEITAISRGLKGLAKELDCPVLALSQLSRKTESREGSRPLMSDMRESGAIEQDADVVMLLYREDYYNEDTDKPNVTEVIIAKHRNGPTGTVELYFKKELTRFNDISYEDPKQGY